MMKSISVLFVFCLVALVAVVALGSQDWEDYKHQYGKLYSSRADEAERKALFERRLLLVNMFNANLAEKSGYSRGLNPMSDWTDKERSARNGLKLTHDMENAFATEQVHLKAILDSGRPAPPSINWCDLGRCTPVQDQGKCGSDWAFATVGLLEGQRAAKSPDTGKTIPLSVQQLLDCPNTETYKLKACQGGDMHSALEFLANEGAISSATSYPYQGVQDVCRDQGTKDVLRVKGSAVIKSDEETLKKLVALLGPVAVGVDASSFAFQDYKTGVFSCPSYGKLAINHAVLIVGYGTDEQGRDFWIVKNSWGRHWGEDGFIRIARNKSTCGIGRVAVIPMI